MDSVLSGASGMEVVNVRVFPQSRDTVFGAFENPDQLARWWGPKGFRSTVKTFDFRAGGVWRMVLHGPDGTDYDNESTFVEVVKPERVVFNHSGPVHPYRMTMTFEDVAGQTRLTWRMLSQPNAETDKLKDFFAEANEQNFDRLGLHLETRGR